METVVGYDGGCRTVNSAIITGANGFIGSALVAEALAHGVAVTAVVRDGHRDRLYDHPALRIVSCDMERISDLKNKISGGAEVFFHCAWEGVFNQKREDITTQLNNVQTSVDALKAAASLGCRRFVGAGSLREREILHSLYQSGHKPAPGYLYGGAKAIVHIITKALAAQLGVELVWGVLSNVYGVGDTSSFLINSTIRKILDGQPLSFTAGTQNIDFIYISDVARAFYLMGEAGVPNGCYTVSSGDVRPLREYLLEIKDILAPETDFLFGVVPFTGTNLPLEDFDCTRLKADTGFIPQVSFSQGIIRTAEWLKGMRNA